MKTKLPKLLDKLADYKYKGMFGAAPRIIVDLSDGHTQIAFPHDNADYVELGEASNTLVEFIDLIRDINDEIGRLKGAK